MFLIIIKYIFFRNKNFTFEQIYMIGGRVIRGINVSNNYYDDRDFLSNKILLYI